MKREDHITAFVETIWEWFPSHKRELPWRDLQISDDAERAYRVLVSEIMLQQTQVSRVKILYRDFLNKYDSIESLSKANNREIIESWRGLGYNNRALRLRDIAKTIVNEKRGIFPKNMDELLALKGIGHYTAAAVRNFAFDLPTPCLDTNIRRILHRTFYGPEKPDGTFPVSDRELLDVAAEALAIACRKKKNRPAAEWHAALMDFGSIICTKRNPQWQICPLTARGLMKAAHKVPVLLPRAKRRLTQEPGREIAGKFVPNRIIRGRIVEALRDHPRGLTFDAVGSFACIDWNPKKHRDWLHGVVESLIRDRLIEKKRSMLTLESR